MYNQLTKLKEGLNSMANVLGAEVGRKPVTLVNQETGEQIEGVAIYKQADSDNFLKVHLADLLAMLGILESKQSDIVVYLLKKTDFSRNIFIGTHRKIAEETGISKYTVTATMSKLEKARLIAKVQNGVYQLSPALAFKGDMNRRAYIVQYYCDNCPEPDKDYVAHAKPPQKRNRDTSSPPGWSDGGEPA